jgi:hypothetical protein
MTARNPTQRPAPTYSGGTASYGAVQPLERTDLRQSGRAMQNIGDVFFRLAEVGQQRLTQDATVWAQREGKKFGGLDTKEITVVTNGKAETVKIPTLTRASGGGAVARAWDQGAEQAHAARLDAVTMGEVTRIGLQNQGDPEGLATALAAFATGVKTALPADQVADYDKYLMRLAQPMIIKAQQDQLTFVANERKIAMKELETAAVGSLVANASLEGAAGISGATVNAGIMQNLVNAAYGRVDGITYGKAEAISYVNGIIRKAVPGIVQAQFASAANKEAWLASFLKGEVRVSVPHVDWETGKVTAGAYDPMSLTSLMDPADMGATINMMQADIRAQDVEARLARAENRELTENAKDAAGLAYLADPTPANFAKFVQFTPTVTELAGVTSLVQAGGLGVQPATYDRTVFGIIYDSDTYNRAQLAEAGFNHKQQADILKIQEDTADVLGRPEFKNARMYVDTAIGGFVEGMVFLPSNQQTELQRQTATQLSGKLLDLSVQYQRQGYSMTNDATITVDDENKKFSPLGIVKAAEKQVNERVKVVDTQMDTLTQQDEKIKTDQATIQARVDKGEETDTDLSDLDKLQRQRRELRQALRKLQDDRANALRDIVEGMQ